MARKYYTLCIRHETSGNFCPEFGDWSRSVVMDERDDLLDHDIKRKNIRVISTGGTQAEINAGVARLNRIAAPAVWHIREVDADRAPEAGLVWLAEHPTRGAHFFPTRDDAAAFIRNT